MLRLCGQELKVLVQLEFLRQLRQCCSMEVSISKLPPVDVADGGLWVGSEPEASCIMLGWARCLLWLCWPGLMQPFQLSCGGGSNYDA